MDWNLEHIYQKYEKYNYSLHYYSTIPFLKTTFPNLLPIQVFKHRFWPLLYLYWAYTAYGIVTAPSLAFAIGAFILTYIYIDLYGAVLHIVLDNPNFLKLPLLGEACLEFQVSNSPQLSIPTPLHPSLPPSLLLLFVLTYMHSEACMHSPST